MILCIKGKSYSCWVEPLKTISTVRAHIRQYLLGRRVFVHCFILYLWNQDVVFYVTKETVKQYIQCDTYGNYIINYTEHNWFTVNIII